MSVDKPEKICYSNNGRCTETILLNVMRGLKVNIFLFYAFFLYSF